MNEVEFRNWLINKGVKTKVAGNTISRLKRIEREIENCEILGLFCVMPADRCHPAKSGHSASLAEPLTFPLERKA